MYITKPNVNEIKQPNFPIIKTIINAIFLSYKKKQPRKCENKFVDAFSIISI